MFAYIHESGGQFSGVQLRNYIIIYKYYIIQILKYSLLTCPSSWWSSQCRARWTCPTDLWSPAGSWRVAALPSCTVPRAPDQQRRWQPWSTAAAGWTWTTIWLSRQPARLGTTGPWPSCRCSGAVSSAVFRLQKPARVMKNKQKKKSFSFSRLTRLWYIGGI